MIKDLKRVISKLPELLEDKDKWGSQFIDYDNPYVHRIYRKWGKLIINLHRFTPTNGEIIWHPHPWPAAFIISKGAYELQMGKSKDGGVPEPAGPIVMLSGSFYQMISEQEWHSVRPLGDTYTLAVQGPAYKTVNWSFETDDRKAFRSLTKKEQKPIFNHFSSKKSQKFLLESINRYRPNKNGMYSFEP